jgi:uncharacterized protein
MRDDGPAPLADPIWLERSVVLRAGATGIFYAPVERRAVVQTGAPIGRIPDFYGRVLEEIVAPFDGEIMYIVDTPPISKGEPIAMVSGL